MKIKDYLALQTKADELKEKLKAYLKDTYQWKPCYRRIVGTENQGEHFVCFIDTDITIIPKGITHKELEAWENKKICPSDCPLCKCCCQSCIRRCCSTTQCVRV